MGQDDLVFILTGLSVTLLICGFWQIGKGVTKNDKKRLHNRLNAIGGTNALSALPKSIALNLHSGSLSTKLVRYQLMRKIYFVLHQAYPDATIGKFVVISVGLAITGLIGATAYTGNPAAGLMAGAVLLVAPFGIVLRARKKRIMKISAQLPESLDFMSRVLRAGHSLSMALKMMGEELPEPTASEFRRCYDQHSVGQPLEDCLKEIGQRVDSPDVAFLITAILIQRQTGGDLSVVLNNISEMVRQRVRLAQQVRAKTAEGRFTGYILVAFPVVMFFLTYFLNPKYADTLLHNSQGQMLLGVALGLEIAGLFGIRKVTQVKV